MWIPYPQNNTQVSGSQVKSKVTQGFFHKVIQNTENFIQDPRDLKGVKFYNSIKYFLIILSDTKDKSQILLGWSTNGVIMLNR